MKKRYWHRLSQQEQDRIFGENLSTDEFWQRFKAPSWCDFHEEVTKARLPQICMSLIRRGKVIGKKVNCSRCSFCKK